MRPIKDFVIERIKQLKADIVDATHLTVDERNQIFDELDDLQETIAYRDIPRV